MKNSVECYKDFFGYFNALKTNCVRIAPKRYIIPNHSPLFSLITTYKLFNAFLSQNAATMKYCENKAQIGSFWHASILSGFNSFFLHICVFTNYYFSRMIGFVPNCSASILVAVIVCHIDLRPKVLVAVMEL